jgi:predicted nucleic-acid-binding protein
LIAIDTNIVVRFLVNDDEAQGRRARALIAGGEILLAPTVLLETEWVLRAGYRMKAQEIARHFRNLLGLPGIFVAEPDAMARALEGYDAGLDFADALHVTHCAGAAAFATFDTRLTRRARRLGGIPVVHP